MSSIRSVPKKQQYATLFSAAAYQKSSEKLVSEAFRWARHEVDALVRAVEPLLPNSVSQTLTRLLDIAKPDNRDNLTWYYHGFSQRLYVGANSAQRSTTYTNLNILEELCLLTRRGGQKRENGRFACDKSAVNYRINLGNLAKLAYVYTKERADLLGYEIKSPIPDRHLAVKMVNVVLDKASEVVGAIGKGVDKLLKGSGKAEDFSFDLHRSPKNGLQCSAGDIDKGEDQKLNNNNKDYSDFSAFEKLDPSDFSALDDPG